MSFRLGSILPVKALKYTAHKRKTFLWAIDSFFLLSIYHSIAKNLESVMID